MSVLNDLSGDDVPSSAPRDGAWLALVAGDRVGGLAARRCKLYATAAGATANYSAAFAAVACRGDLLASTDVSRSRIRRGGWWCGVGDCRLIGQDLKNELQRVLLVDLHAR